MPETVASPAAASPKPHLQPAPNQLLTRLINEKSRRLSPERAPNCTPGLPEGDAREIVREVPKEVLPQVLLSDGVTVRASPKSAVEGRNL